MHAAGRGWPGRSRAAYWRGVMVAWRYALGCEQGVAADAAVLLTSCGGFALARGAAWR